jgi:hypothetical protein
MNGGDSVMTSTILGDMYFRSSDCQPLALCYLIHVVLLIFTIKWEFVTAIGYKTRLIYIIESILAIQSTSNGMLYD